MSRFAGRLLPIALLALGAACSKEGGAPQTATPQATAVETADLVLRNGYV